MVKWLSWALIFASMALIVSSASAQSSDPEWLDSLRMQLRAHENCEVQYFLNLRENQNAAGNTYSARVQCEDGRRFDATRMDPETDFTFETCEQAVCEVKSETNDNS